MPTIEKLIESENIAKLLEEEDLKQIASDAIIGYDNDYDSLAGWRDKYEGAIELAEQIRDKKKWPFEGASNFMYPLISTAAIQFASRAYPQFMGGPSIVKARVVGSDSSGDKAKKANRVAMHMSYQLMNEVVGFEEEIDKMLAYLPIIGTAFIKTYYDTTHDRPVVEFRRATDVVMHYYAKSMDSVPRITDRMELYPREIDKFIRSGAFSDFDYFNARETKSSEEDESSYADDPHHAHLFLEQHTFLDLDNDGIQEPYIVTIHKDTEKVVRITARFNEDGIKTNDDGDIIEIVPIQHFVKFSFMPSTSGSIYDTGLGGTLEPINRAINTTVNQTIDAAALRNLQSGIIGKGVHLGRGRGGGDWTFKPGEWKKVLNSGDDIRKSLLPLPFPGPAPETFSLLQLMIQAGEKQSSVNEVLTGTQSNESERPTTTLARIEQSLQVFSGVYMRIYRAMTVLFKLIYRMNSYYVTETRYYDILDYQIETPPGEQGSSIAQSPIQPSGAAVQPEIGPPGQVQPGSAPDIPDYAPDASDFYSKAKKQNFVFADDYDYKSCDIVPVANPNEMTNTQKLMKAQIWMSMRGQGFNDKAIMKRFVEAMQDPNPDELLEAPPPPIPPDIQIAQEELQLKKDKFLLDTIKYADENPKRAAQVVDILTRAMKNEASSEAAIKGQQLNAYKASVETLFRAMEMKTNSQEDNGNVSNNQGRMGALAQVPGNPGDVPNLEIQAGQAGGDGLGGGQSEVQGGVPPGMGALPGDAGPLEDDIRGGNGAG